MLNLLHDTEAERRFLSACLSRPNLIARYMHFHIKVFHDKFHRDIWKGLIQMPNQDSINVGTLSSLIRKDNDSLVDEDYIIDLQMLLATETSAQVDADTIMYYNKLRRIHQLASRTQANVLDKLPIDKIKKSIEAMDNIVDETTFEQVKFEQYIEWVLSDGQSIPVSRTWYKQMDETLTWYKPGQLIVIWARPWMGKTTLMLNTMFNQAIIEKKVMFISLEMSSEEVATRLFALASGYSYKMIENKQYTPEEYDDLVKFSKLLKDAPISVIDNALTFNSIIYAIKDQSRRTGLDVVYIDYLQLLGGDSENRTQELSGYTKKLKILAKELNITIVTWSQLNRGNEKRADKRPVVSDLRESGSIEQDADIVMLLYRDVIYDPDTEYPDIIEVNIAKHRNGSNKNVLLWFNWPSMQIQDIAIEDLPWDF